MTDNNPFHGGHSSDFSFIPPVRHPRKVKPKRIITSKYDLKKLYYDARMVMFRREYPAGWEAGSYYDNKFPDVTTTNGTTRYIEDVINNLGQHAERVNTQGNYRNGQWHKSGSTKGSPDIHCIVNGKTWKIELKKGSDDLNKAQKKYEAKMNKLGITHTVLYVGGLDEFWDELNKLL